MVGTVRCLLASTAAFCVSAAVPSQEATLQCTTCSFNEGYKDELPVQTLLQQSGQEHVKDLSASVHEEAAVGTAPTGGTKKNRSSSSTGASSSNGSSTDSSKGSDGSGSFGVPSMRRDMHSYDAAQTLKHDLDAMGELLFPDITFSCFTLCAEICVVLGVCVWFTVFYHCVYQPDTREEGTGVEGTMSMGKDMSLDLSPEKKANRMRSVSYGSLNPDMVLVFHHPIYACPDGNSEVTLRQIDRTLLKSSPWRRVTKLLDIENVVPAGKTVWENLFVQSHQRWRKKQPSIKTPNTEDAAPEVTAHEVASDWSDQEEESDAANSGAHPKGLASVRIALMKDLIEAMLACGMDVCVHRSMDQKRLLVFVALTDGIALEHYLVKDQILLRVRSEVLGALNVAQLHDSLTSSPVVPFDPRLLSSLEKAGIIDSPVKEEFFETHASPKKGDPPSVLSSSDRARIIFRELTTRIDLEQAKHYGLLTDWWPVHTRRLQDFDNTWVSRRSLQGMFFRQPISAVREYFGSQVAIMFAFKSLYSKSFLALAPVALSFELALNIQYLMGNDSLHMHSYAKGFSACLAIVIWSRITANLWDRERQLLLELWGLKEHGKSQSLPMVRPCFRGFPGPSRIDANETEDQYSEFWYSLRMLFSTFVTLVFCGLVLVSIFIWRNQFESRMGVVASLYLSVIIKTFEFVFNMLADKLSHFDNHKYEDDYVNSLVLRKFLFQAVTNYSAFFYIALKHCIEPGSGTRYHLLRYELVIMQIILSLFAIAQVAWNILSVSHKVRRIKESEEVMSFAEEQGHYTQFNTHHQVEMMSQLMVSLGFIILFGSVAPIMAVFSFLVFTIQLRGYAYILATAARRTIPHENASCENWRMLMSGLMHLGVLISGLFMTLFGHAFKHSSVQTRITGVLAFSISSFITWGLVDLMVPSRSVDAELLQLRRSHVWSKIINTCSRVENLFQLGQDEIKGRFRTRADSHEVNKSPRAALAGHWSSISPVPVGVGRF